MLWCNTMFFYPIARLIKYDKIIRSIITTNVAAQKQFDVFEVNLGGSSMHSQQLIIFHGGFFRMFRVETLDWWTTTPLQISLLKGVSLGRGSSRVESRNRNGTSWALTEPPMNVNGRVRRLSGWKVGQHPSVSQEILIFYHSLSSVISALCYKKQPSASILYHPFPCWVFFLSSDCGLNDTFGCDSQMYIRIERGGKWPWRWVFMHYRSLDEQPESHSATISQDEGPTGSLPARK